MPRITLDAELVSKLMDLSQPVELCDESGNVVGRFFPVLAPAEYEPWEPVFAEEELRRLEQSSEKRYTTAEVLEHLRKL